MATTNLIEKTIGDIVIGHGNGTPNHVSKLGSLYIDIDTGLYYRNNDGNVGWDVDFPKLTSGDTIYASDGALSGDRVISGDTNTITFDNVSEFNVNDKDVYDLIRDFFRTGEGINLLTELSVGSIEQPFESVFGEGDSTPEGMLVYTFDGSVYADISTNAQSADGSSFTFPNNVAGNAIYVTMTKEQNGFKYVPHGIKVKMDNPATYIAGDLEFQVFNGVTWQKVNVMSIEDVEPYYSFADVPFQAQSQDSEQIYFDNTVDTIWELNDPVSLGQDYYWFRIIINNPLSVLPDFEQFKIHTSRYELNSNGFAQKFGNARTRKQLPWSLGDLEAANNSPVNQDVYASDTVAVGRVENAFQNATIDRSGLNIFLPADIDTSSPIILKFAAISSDSSAGDVNFTIRTAYTVQGDNVYHTTGTAPTVHPTQIDYPAVAPAPNPLDTVLYYEVPIDVSEINPNPKTNNGATILWVSFERDGTDITDTHTGTVSLVTIEATYVTWCEGAYANTAQLNRVVDFQDDFESGSFLTSGWTTVNSSPNNWVVGTAEAESGSFSAYISSDGGVSATYTATGGAPDISHVYIDVPIPVGAISPQLFFNWQGELEDGAAFDEYDFMKVYAITTGTTIVADTLLSEANRIGEEKYLEASTWQSETINIPNTFIGDTVRIVFSFQTDVSIVNTPSACIDNVTVFHFEQ